MNRLESQYYKDVDFIHLNLDNNDLNNARLALGIRGRSEYVLYDGEGNEIGRWFGSLSDVGPIVKALQELTQN